MSSTEPGRAMTPFAPFERKLSEPRIPGPPPLPTDIGQTEPTTKPPPSQIDQIEEQLASVHDALHSPDGLLHALFAALDQKAAARHEELMRTLTTIANGQVELSERVGGLEPDVERHEAQLKLVALRAAE